MPVWLIIVGAAAALLLLARRGGGGAPSGGIVPPAGTGVGAIIDALYQRQLRDLPAIRAHYNLSRLRRIARAAAKAWGVPAEWVWGIMWRESKWTPIGVYGHSAEKARAVAGGKGSSAYGMAQMLGSRFRGEKSWAQSRYPGAITWTHQDLVDPKRTIWTVAASLRRAVEKHGAANLTASGNRLLGQWWASPGRDTAGSERKARDIRDKGPDVWSTVQPPASWTAVPIGPTGPEDDQPPAGWPGVEGGAAAPSVDDVDDDADGFWDRFLAGGE